MSNTITFFRNDWEAKKHKCQSLITQGKKRAQMAKTTGDDGNYRHWQGYLAALEQCSKDLNELENQDIDFNK